MLEALLALFPNVQREHLADLAAVWDVQRDRVIKRMIAIARDEIGSAVPTPSRERLILKLAQLSVWLEARIIAKNTENTPIEQIQPATEWAALETQLIRERIDNTARNLSERVWIPVIEQERTRSPFLLGKDGASTKPRRSKVVTKGAAAVVREQHYAPAFANRYWTGNPKIAYPRLLAQS